ncbi:MAG: phosphatase PAP2 family protein [Pseudobdellovibrio sp.]
MLNQFLDPLFELILQADYKLMYWINQILTTTWLDQFFPWITDLHKTLYFPWIVFPLLFFFFYKKFKRAGITLFLILFLALTVADFSGSIVKNHFLRPRPFQNQEIQITQKSPAGSKSFYSNHASNMFTFAAYTSNFFPAAKIPLYALASVVSYSRLYNGVHYPSDIFAGGFMGIIWGLFFSSLAQRCLKLITAKKENASNKGIQ